MDQQPSDSPDMPHQVNESGDERDQISSPIHLASKEEQQNRAPRRPGRPPLRIKNRLKRPLKAQGADNQNDEDFEGERPKGKQRNMFYKEEKQNNLEGFIKIIDYLKRIQYDQTSLHNKMNPYNLLTPTCFWYMVSAQYFSFDFFNNKSPQDTALQFVKKAQRTQIILPLRFIKPQKMQAELEFENPQLRAIATPVAEKLTVFTYPNCSNIQTSMEQVEKSGFLTSISEDNYFRSSTRAIVFNWLKKKVANEKWYSAIKPKPEMLQKIPSKQFTSRVFERVEEVKHEQLEVAPQIYYRQRKVHRNNINQVKKTKPIKRVTKDKRRAKKSLEDEIYDESESEVVIKNEENLIPQPISDNNIEEEQPENKISDGDAPKQNIEDPEIKNQEIDNVKNEMQNEALPNNPENSDDEEEEGMKRIYETITIIKNYTQNDVLLDALLHMPLDNVIAILKSAIKEPKIPALTRPYMPPPKNDPLQLVYQIHPDEEVFLNYMKQRQQKMYLEKTNHSDPLMEQKQREGQVEDAKCQVCTDGDYTQDNLIVFCSMCNISLHQRCVGLAKVPADNWVCEACASFGPAGINVPCPLCHVKGGALKRTSIHINTPLFKETNPEYHQFAKKCPNYKHKEEYIHPKSGKGEEQPYYDYFSKTTYPTDEPVCHFVWVHYVCAIWIPECYFEQKNGLINIKGIQNIDKKRFKEKCLVCREVRAGACVKCDNENCTKFYHPECARKKKIYMEQLNLDKLKYLIFCQAHQPLKVKRKIEVKKKKQRDQIVKFCRGIEKYVQTYKIANLPFKLLKLGNTSGAQMNRFDPKKQKMQQGEQKIMVKLQKNTDEDFIKSVIDGLIKQNQIIVNLSCLGNDRYKIDEVIKPSKRDMRKSLTRQDEFWKNYKSTETPQANLRRFNTITRQNNYLKQKIENFINFGNNAEQSPGKDMKKPSRRGIGRRRKQQIETVVQQHGALFCVCRRPYNGQNDMFECEVCNQWYHHECIGFVGSEQDAQKLVFHCMKCLKYESPDVKKELLDKCSQLFSEDSLYLNYRPPTPSLQSEEESMKDNYDESKKDNFELKPFTISIEPTEKPQQKNGRAASTATITINDQNIPNQRINLEMPFIVYDPKGQNPEPKEKIVRVQIAKVHNDEESPNFGPVKQPQLPEKMKNQRQVVHESGPSHKLKISQAGPNISIEPMREQEAAHESVNRTISSHSSQLPTPEFKPGLFSFAFAGDQQKYKNSEGNKGELLNLSSFSLSKSQVIQPQNNKPNNDFHFNRLEISKLKDQIQEQEKQVNDNVSPKNPEPEKN